MEQEIGHTDHLCDVWKVPSDTINPFGSAEWKDKRRKIYEYSTRHCLGVITEVFY